ncbi:MAG: arginine--tRNA ligase, partial [Candidatus Hodarchaeota archaeon]
MKMKIIDKKTIAEILVKHIPVLNREEIETLLEIPPSDIHFTYAFPCFKLSKYYKKAPNQIAQELKDKIKVPEFIKHIEVSGPYINFKISPKIILENIFKFKTDYGRIREIPLKDVKSRVVIEYPSPNTNKSLHFGHVRNILLGKSLSNLLKYKGHKVFEVNLLNNRGIHICKSMLAYKKWGNNKQPD